MKLTSLALLFGASSLVYDGTLFVDADAEIPTQTFFIPLPEKDVFDRTFKRINSVAAGPVNSIIAISISTPNTIVWYDHHEDGFEADYRNTSSFSKTTQIWGDGNCANGFAFGTTCRSPADDVLRAGQSIVIENEVSVAANANNGIKYDGGDKILASYPIAITRGMYPDNPGSLLAGAVEVLDTAEWGTFYVLPVGQSVSSPTSAFEHTSVYVMALQDGTTVNFSDGTKYTINSGDSITHIVDTLGETLTSSAPVQVDLLAGDVGSTYQVRWYAIIPRAAWTNSYLSPVGDTTGGTKIYLYNPDTNALSVTVTHSSGTRLVNGRQQAYPAPYQVNVPAGSFQFTNVIDSGTGARLSASKPFIALSLTDTVGAGQLYDWGFPVLPLNKLTEKVLVGWGYGCTEKKCLTPNNKGGQARSVVWISPVEDADIYVDINNDGIPELNKSIMGARALSSNMIENGVDMSGAVIWAVKPGQPHDCMLSVGIAAAWGQNPEFSFSNDQSALDLGTLVPPFIGVRVDEVVDLAVDKDGDGKISPGDDVIYTIQVQNAGQRDYAPCDYRIKNPGLPANLPRQTYVNSTCIFINDGKQQSCNDASLNGGNGLCSPVILSKRGGVHFYKFRATVGSPAQLDEAAISNRGELTQTGLGPVLPFSAPAVVHFQPSINIEKTVHLGKLITCLNGQELVRDRQGTIVTYCFEVKNTGNTYLDKVVVTDPDNGMSPITTIPFMAPGDVSFVKFETTMPPTKIATSANVTANPLLVNKKVIPTYQGGPVTDSDSAGVDPIPYVPKVSIKKYAGPSGISCNIAKMKDDIYLAENTKFEYCYVIKNLGDECLVNVVLTDNAVGGIGSKSIPKLCPNDSEVIVTGATTTSLLDIPSTNATVVGKGEFSGVSVTSSDPAAIDIPAFAPKLSIKKYAGPQGSSCNIAKMADDKYVAQDTKFEYCYIVKNIGNECVVNITLSDSAVGGIGSVSIPKFCPSDTAYVNSGAPTTTKVDIPSTNAKVTGKGEFSGLIASANDPAAVDVPEFAPMLSIKKYAGPQGSSCNIANMVDDKYVAKNTRFEYCYIITNVGNECVVNVTLSDNALGGIGTQSIAKSCPGDSPITLSGPPSTSKVDIPSTDASVTGAGEYSGLLVSKKDPAAIDIPDFIPQLSIKKYAGPQGSACAVENMEDDTYAAQEGKFEYCYVITNTGNECIINLALADGAVGGIPSRSIEKVCPEDAPSTLVGPLTLTEEGVPSTDAIVTGTGEYSGKQVDAKDPAAVQYVKPTVRALPGISIEKTVHLGEVTTCFAGQELEYGFSGTVVTYCYEVKNTGNIALDVTVSDSPVGISESFPLEVGSSVFVKKISSITSDLASPGKAIGTVADSDDTVEDSDPAGVKLLQNKPVCE